MKWRTCAGVPVCLLSSPLRSLLPAAEWRRMHSCPCRLKKFTLLVTKPSCLLLPCRLTEFMEVISRSLLPTSSVPAHKFVIVRCPTLPPPPPPAYIHILPSLLTSRGHPSHFKCGTIGLPNSCVLSYAGYADSIHWRGGRECIVASCIGCLG